MLNKHTLALGCYSRMLLFNNDLMIGFNVFILSYLCYCFCSFFAYSVISLLNLFINKVIYLFILFIYLKPQIISLCSISMVYILTLDDIMFCFVLFSDSVYSDMNNAKTKSQKK